MKPNVHIKSLLKVLSQGVYEKEHIIAMSLLSTIAGESIFLLRAKGLKRCEIDSWCVWFLIVFRAKVSFIR